MTIKATIYPTVITILLTLAMCNPKDKSGAQHLEGNNQFSPTADTLLIKASRMKGTGVFEFGAGYLTFQDTTNLFGYAVDYPESLTKIQGFRFPADLRYELDYIDIISGQLPSGDTVVIVDQNNNQSFRDDSVFSLQRMDWYSSRNSIPITFLISDGTDTVERHSLVRIGLWNGEILFGRDEHLSASFSINDKHFDVAIIDERNFSYSYGLEPEIVLLATEPEKADSIEVRDLIKVKEYLRLNGIYYKFDSISNAGNYVRLIKEKNFENKIGLQVGMLAPEFKFKLMSGDTMRTASLHDKPLVIANSCGCGGDTESLKASVEIRKALQDDAYVLRLDSFKKNSSDEWTINMEDGNNKDGYDKFRQQYCSRICYVIGLDRRVVNKFQVTDWKRNLTKIKSLHVGDR